jgi:predicted aspartyl protease
VKGLPGWVLISSLVLVAPTSYSQVNASIAGAIAGPETSTVKTFDLRESFLIVVEGRIGPLEHLKFILDTGASHTVVSRKIADQLALARRPGTVINFQKRLPVEWAQVPEVQLGPIVATNSRMMVADLDQYTEFARGIDAIAGLDLLSRCERLQVDYERKLVVFQARPTALQVPHFQARGVVVTATLQDRPVRLLVDTGFQEIALLEDRLRARGQRFHVEEIAREQIGSLLGEEVRVPGLRIGSDQQNAPVLLVRGKTEMVPDGLDGYLGPRALGAKKIELDFASMLLRWQ